MALKIQVHGVPYSEGHKIVFFFFISSPFFHFSLSFPKKVPVLRRVLSGFFFFGFYVNIGEHEGSWDS